MAAQRPRLSSTTGRRSVAIFWTEWMAVSVGWPCAPVSGDGVLILFGARPGQQASEEDGVNFQAGQFLSQYVVDLASDSGPLFLANGLHAGGQRAEMLPGDAQPLFRLPPRQCYREMVGDLLQMGNLPRGEEDRRLSLHCIRPKIVPPARIGMSATDS